MDLNLPETRSEVGYYRIKAENKEWLNARAREESDRHNREISAAIVLDKYLDDLRKKHPVTGDAANGVKKKRAKKAKAAA